MEFIWKKFACVYVILIYNLGISVSCAPGSYYSSNTAKCTPCPIGQYQSSSGQTACTSCPGGQTTYNTGAEASTLCYGKCCVPENVNMISVVCLKDQYDKCCMPEKSI
jgi:hypothetical protein